MIFKNPVREFEEKELNSFHLKTMLLAGAGQIVDGYDLTAGALVLSLLETSLHANLSSSSITLFGSIILGNIVGGLLFGYLSKKGRKRFYGIDAILMVFGALSQAFVSNSLELGVARFLLGLGIGADYVLSPMITAEYSNRKDRGKLMGVAGGVMWNVGALLSVLSTILMASFLPSDLLWRTVLASGSIPALAVIVGRRRVPETPHYLAFVKGDTQELKREYGLPISDETEGRGPKEMKGSRNWLRKEIVLSLFLAALAWYFYDIAAYSGVFFGPSVIAKDIGVNYLLFGLLILGVFAVPFNFLGALLSDKAGRRLMQMIGFLGMGLFTLIFAFLLGTEKDPYVSLIIYGLSAAFNSLGPGTIVGYWGVELFPASIRGITQGITVVGGRLGVITTTLAIPPLLQSVGIKSVMVGLALISFMAVAVTYALKEPKRVALSEMEVSGGVDIKGSEEGESSMQNKPIG